MALELSVIIPALNEQDCLPRLLADLQALLFVQGGDNDRKFKRHISAIFSSDW